MRIVVGFIALVGFAATAAAQTAPSSPAPSAAPPAAAAPAQPATKLATKPVDCRADARTKGLRGPAARDSIALCVEELRLACLKEAIEKKIVGKARGAFIRSCSRRPKAGDKGGKS